MCQFGRIWFEPEPTLIILKKARLCFCKSCHERARLRILQVAKNIKSCLPQINQLAINSYPCTMHGYSWIIHAYQWIINGHEWLALSMDNPYISSALILRNIFYSLMHGYAQIHEIFPDVHGPSMDLYRCSVWIGGGWWGRGVKFVLSFFRNREEISRRSAGTTESIKERFRRTWGDLSPRFASFKHVNTNILRNSLFGLLVLLMRCLRTHAEDRGGRG